MSLKKIQPPFLNSGDEVAIISPAFSIDEAKVEEAVKFLENWGLRVHIGRNALKKEGPFAGTDKERLSDFQKMTGNKKIKAIFCSRGGYGILKIIDRIDFSSLQRYPKWYIGFSDVTVLHLWLSEKCNMVSIHGEMPLNYSRTDKSPETFNSLHDALFGGLQPVRWHGKFYNPGKISGEITGGNLSLIFSMIGIPAEPKTKGKILFIEEVGEYLYNLDRMLVSLKLAGKFEGLTALLAGGFSKMEETKTPWGKSPETIVSDVVGQYGFPVLFNFPAGHIPDNRAFYIGKKARIELKEDQAVLDYI